MSSKNIGLIRSLAYAVAKGRTVKAWASENRIPIRTAYSWSGKPKFRAFVEKLQDDQARAVVNSLARHALGAVTELAKIMRQRSGEDGKVRATAATTLLQAFLKGNESAPEFGKTDEELKSMSDAELEKYAGTLYRRRR